MTRVRLGEYLKVDAVPIGLNVVGVAVLLLVLAILALVGIGVALVAALVAAGSMVLRWLVTGFRRREADLRESEARFRDLIEGSIQGILIHRGFVPLFANDAYARIFGFERAAEILALPTLEALMSHEEAPRAWRTYFLMMDGQQGPGLCRVVRQRPDGSPVWCEVIERAIDWLGAPAMQVTVVDISDRVRAEAEAAVTSEQLQTAFQAMPNGICLFDDDFRVVIYNERFLQLWDWPKSLMVSSTRLADLIRLSVARGDFGARVADDLLFEMGTYINGGMPLVGEVRLGDGRVLEFRGNSRYEGGYLLTCTDISQHKRAEETLRHAKELAEEAVKSKSTFLATMSHEIRTPMNGVLGMLEVLEGTRLDTEQHKFVAVVRESAQSLLTIINDILDFSKIEAGRLDIENVPMSLTALVEGVANLLSTRSREQRLDMIVDVDPSLPDARIGDPVRLRQVLINLVGNALKFTERGSVVVTVRRGTGEDLGRVRFEVADTGIGLSDALQAKLFEPFSQADPSTTRRYGGSGLGLSICRRLVALMNGEIGARGVVGLGSTFWFEVPLAVDTIPNRSSEKRWLDIVNGLSGLRVLIIDDTPAASRAFERMLSVAGAEVVVSLDAVAGLEALKQGVRDGQPFQVLLLDHDQDHIDGLALVRWMNDAVPKIEAKVVLTTPLDDVGIAAAAERLGVAEVLFKPVRRVVVERAVARAAGRWADDIPTAVPATGLCEMRLPSREEAQIAGALILVAEDNPTNQVVIRQQFKRLGFVADLVEDGEAAWEALQTTHYGLLVTDCFMPRLDGYALTRRVRVNESLSGGHLPIVALTAAALFGEADKCLAVGMDGYLAKPVEMRDLEAVVARWLPGALALRRQHQAEPSAVVPLPSAPVLPPETSSLETPSLATPSMALDIGFIESLFGGREEARPMMEYFLETTAPLIDDVARHLEAGCAEEARFAIHSAAGAARTAGALDLAIVAAAIEGEIINGDLLSACGLVPEMMAAFARVTEAVRNEL